MVFPGPCSLCGEELSEANLLGICRACWESLTPWEGGACSRCGLPFPSEQPTASGEPLCAQCRLGEFQFELARSYGIYTGSLRSAILQFKFRRRERLGMKLGELLLRTWEAAEQFNSLESPVLVPVPLHATRERERGFNQAELLARGLSRRLKQRDGNVAPSVETKGLSRTRATPPQTGLSLRARHENVRGVFAVSVAGRVRGRAVVLVDDVMTTGATLSACAAALLEAGAERVLALTLARATPQFPDVAPGGVVTPVDDLAGG